MSKRNRLKEDFWVDGKRPTPIYDRDHKSGNTSVTPFDFDAFYNAAEPDKYTHNLAAPKASLPNYAATMVDKANNLIFQYLGDQPHPNITERLRNLMPDIEDMRELIAGMDETLKPFFDKAFAEVGYAYPKGSPQRVELHDAILILRRQARRINLACKELRECMEAAGIPIHGVEATPATAKGREWVKAEDIKRHNIEVTDIESAIISGPEEHYTPQSAVMPEKGHAKHNSKRMSNSMYLMKSAQCAEYNEAHFHDPQTGLNLAAQCLSDACDALNTYVSHYKFDMYYMKGERRSYYDRKFGRN